MYFCTVFIIMSIALCMSASVACAPRHNNNLAAVLKILYLLGYSQQGVCCRNSGKQIHKEDIDSSADASSESLNTLVLGRHAAKEGTVQLKNTQ